jgi:hypothetical protein
MKQILIFLTPLLFFCCASRKPIDYSLFALTDEEKNSISCRTILTTGLDKKEDPIDDVKEFQVKDGTDAWIYVTWFELLPGKQYYVTIKWIDPNNEKYEQDDYIFTPKSRTYYEWFALTLKEKVTPRGKFKARLYINHHFVKEAEFELK